MTNTCAIKDCLNKHFGRGWCELHYKRWSKSGDPLFTKHIRGDIEARFLSYVDRSYVCWLWTGHIDPVSGYARLNISKKMVYAHRWSYEHYIGPIPSSLQIDHLCRVRHCVNPMHLEPVTAGENQRRGYQARAREATTLKGEML